MVLQAVVSQQLIPARNASVIPVFELMKTTTAIRNQIREGKTHQLNISIQTAKDEGSYTMDMNLQKLLDASKITIEIAKLYALDKDMIKEKA
jgi:twitching motility protein PilT